MRACERGEVDLVKPVGCGDTKPSREHCRWMKNAGRWWTGAGQSKILVLQPEAVGTLQFHHFMAILQGKHTSSKAGGGDGAAVSS